MIRQSLTMNPTSQTVALLSRCSLVARSPPPVATLASPMVSSSFSSLASSPLSSTISASSASMSPLLLLRRRRRHERYERYFQSRRSQQQQMPFQRYLTTSSCHPSSTSLSSLASSSTQPTTLISSALFIPFHTRMFASIDTDHLLKVLSTADKSKSTTSTQTTSKSSDDAVERTMKLMLGHRDVSTAQSDKDAALAKITAALYRASEPTQRKGKTSKAKAKPKASKIADIGKQNKAVSMLGGAENGRVTIKTYTTIVTVTDKNKLSKGMRKRFNALHSTTTRLVPTDVSKHHKMSTLQARMGIWFEDERLLEKALTPRSLTNERLEFLGDAVLSVVVREVSYHRFSKLGPGALTMLDMILTQSQSCLQFADDLHLESYLFASDSSAEGEYLNGIEIKRVLDAFEALLGAIHVDKGFDVARLFLTNLVNKRIDKLLSQYGSKFWMNPLMMQKGYRMLLQQIATLHFATTTFEISKFRWHTQELGVRYEARCVAKGAVNFVATGVSGIDIHDAINECSRKTMETAFMQQPYKCEYIDYSHLRPRRQKRMPSSTRTALVHHMLTRKAKSERKQSPSIVNKCWQMLYTAFRSNGICARYNLKRIISFVEELKSFKADCVHPSESESKQHMCIVCGDAKVKSKCRNVLVNAAAVCKKGDIEQLSNMIAKWARVRASATKDVDGTSPAEDGGESSLRRHLTTKESSSTQAMQCWKKFYQLFLDEGICLNHNLKACNPPGLDCNHTTQATQQQNQHVCIVCGDAEVSAKCVELLRHAGSLCSSEQDEKLSRNLAKWANLRFLRRHLEKPEARNLSSTSGYQCWELLFSKFVRRQICVTYNLKQLNSVQGSIDDCDLLTGKTARHHHICVVCGDAEVSAECANKLQSAAALCSSRNFAGLRAMLADWRHPIPLINDVDDTDKAIVVDTVVDDASLHATKLSVPSDASVEVAAKDATNDLMTTVDVGIVDSLVDLVDVNNIQETFPHAKEDAMTVKTAPTSSNADIESKVASGPNVVNDESLFQQEMCADASINVDSDALEVPIDGDAGEVITERQMPLHLNDDDDDDVDDDDVDEDDDDDDDDEDADYDDYDDDEDEDDEDDEDDAEFEVVDDDDFDDGDDDDDEDDVDNDDEDDDNDDGRMIMVVDDEIDDDGSNLVDFVSNEGFDDSEYDDDDDDQDVVDLAVDHDDNDESDDTESDSGDDDVDDNDGGDGVADHVDDSCSDDEDRDADDESDEEDDHDDGDGGDDNIQGR